MSRFFSRSSAAALTLVLALSGCAGTYKRAMAHGDELAQRGQWDYAAQEYERAVRARPGDGVALAKLDEAHRHQASERVERAKAALAQGDLAVALELSGEAARLDPRNAEARALREDVARKALDKAEQLLAAGDAKKTLELTTLVLKDSPGDARAKGLDDKARTMLAERAYARATEATKKGKLGSALLDYQTASVLVPSYKDSVARATETKAALKAELAFYAVVARPGGDAKARDISAELTAETIAQTLDRDSVVKIVATLPPGKKQGVRLTASLDGYSFRHDTTSSPRSCNYVCGRETVRNADYQATRESVGGAQARSASAGADAAKAQADVNRYQREIEAINRDVERWVPKVDAARFRLEKCRAGARPNDPYACQSEQQAFDAVNQRYENERARLGAPQSGLDAASQRLATAQNQQQQSNDELNAASQRLASTPETLEVEKSCPFNFAVAEHLVQASVTVVVSLEDVGDRTRLLDREPMPLHVEHKDSAFAAVPGRCAEVAQGDPLELPSERDEKHALATQAVAGLRDKVVAAFDAKRKRMLAEAEHEAVSGVADEAVEHYVRYLVSGKGRVDDGERRRIVDYLARTKDLNARAVEEAM